MDVKFIQSEEFDINVLNVMITTFAKSVKQKWPKTCHTQFWKLESQNMLLKTLFANTLIHQLLNSRIKFRLQCKNKWRNQKTKWNSLVLDLLLRILKTITTLIKTSIFQSFKFHRTMTKWNNLRFLISILWKSHTCQTLKISKCLQTWNKKWFNFYLWSI